MFDAGAGAGSCKNYVHLLKKNLIGNALVRKKFMPYCFSHISLGKSPVLSMSMSTTLAYEAPAPKKGSGKHIYVFAVVRSSRFTNLNNVALTNRCGMNWKQFVATNFLDVVQSAHFTVFPFYNL